MLCVALLTGVAPAHAYLSSRNVPLPKPRPAEAPVASQKPDDADKAETPDRPAGAETPAADVRPAVPPPSACRLALTEAIAVAPSVPDIYGPGACGGPDMVHLEAVMLPDGTKVPLKPGGTMRCTMASAVADWIRTDMVPLASGLGTKVSEIDNFDSFDCRGRNRVVGAKMSEHGRANALDIRAVKLASGQSIALTERTTPRELREKILLSVCTRFTTVLGPGSDGYHEDHIHLDLAERRGNYKICQWNIWDSLPQVAPLLPAVRPDEAPPREVAEESGVKREEKPAAAERQPEPAPEAAIAPAPEPRPPAAPAKGVAAAQAAADKGRAAVPAKSPAPESSVKPGTSVGGAPLKLKPKPRRRRAPPPLFGLFR